MPTSPSVFKAESLWDKSILCGSNGAVISDVRTLLTRNWSTQAIIEQLKEMWDMISFQLPHLEPKYSSEDYILVKKKKL